MTDYPEPPIEGAPGALANWKALNIFYDTFKGYTPADFLGGGGGGQGMIWGGTAPYNFSATSGQGVANRTKLLALIAACQTAGVKGVIPMFFSGGSPTTIPLAPVDIEYAGDRDVWMEGMGRGSCFKQVVDPGTGLATISRKPAAGFALDSNLNPLGNEDYWIFQDGTGSTGTVYWNKMSFNGGHGGLAGASDPNNAAGEAAWLTWGIGMRVPRRASEYWTVHGGSWAGIQFDGDYDHTHHEKVVSQGNWHNVRFGPRQAEKDNVFVSCTFSNSSLSGIAVSRTGFLGGSSFYGCHLGTQPYGIYFESGVKSNAPLNIQCQNTSFYETIWEGVGNYRIFCEDGDTQLMNIGFYGSQWSGIEVGDHDPIHMKYCSVVSNVARAATGIVSVTVDTLGGITPGQYVVMNGYGNQPVEGIKVGGGAADTTLVQAVYRVLTATGNAITMQGTPTTVVASGSVPTTGASGSGRAWLGRVGSVRAGKCTGWRGDIMYLTDEVDKRDQFTFASANPGGFGTAAENFFDVVSMDNCSMYTADLLPVFGPRMTYRAAGGKPSFWDCVGGHFFLAKSAAAISRKSLVTFTGTNGDVQTSIATREPCGVVGGTGAFPFPMSPNGAWVQNLDYVWVQDNGFAEVMGSGTTPQAGSAAAAAGQVMTADATGQAKTLAAGVAPGTTDFRAGTAVATASVSTSLIKL